MRAHPTHTAVPARMPVRDAQTPTSSSAYLWVSPSSCVEALGKSWLTRAFRAARKLGPRAPRPVRSILRSSLPVSGAPVTAPLLSMESASCRGLRHLPHIRIPRFRAVGPVDLAHFILHRQVDRAGTCILGVVLMHFVCRTRCDFSDSKILMKVSVADTGASGLSSPVSSDRNPPQHKPSAVRSLASLEIRHTRLLKHSSTASNCTSSHTLWKLSISSCTLLLRRQSLTFTYILRPSVVAPITSRIIC